MRAAGVVRDGKYAGYRDHVRPCYYLPLGAARYVQRATGYDATIVNGTVFMERGEHTGALTGTTLRS